MPVFEYRALNADGRQITGLKEADSAKSLRALLRKDGVFLTEVTGQQAGTVATKGAKTSGASAPMSRDVNIGKLARGRITTEDIAITTRQLATLLGAGVTLVEALTALVDQ